MCAWTCQISKFSLSFRPHLFTAPKHRKQCNAFVQSVYAANQALGNPLWLPFRLMDWPPDFVLVNVLQHVQAWDDLARIAAVSRQTRTLSTQLQKARFCTAWGLVDLQGGWPRRPLPAFELSHFMLRHVVHKV